MLNALVVLDGVKVRRFLVCENRNNLLPLWKVFDCTVNIFGVGDFDSNRLGIVDQLFLAGLGVRELDEW